MKKERIGYINSLNLNIKTQKDLEALLVEFEEGRLTREEYLTLLFLTQSAAQSRGFDQGLKVGKTEEEEE